MNYGRASFRFFAVLAISAAVASASHTPVQIEQTVDAHFPTALTFTTITSGEARVMINVDDDGKLAGLMITGYSHPAFADDSVSLLKNWRYSPATFDANQSGSARVGDQLHRKRPDYFADCFG